MDDKEKQFLKLKAEPVETELKVGEQLLKVWVHALTVSQNIHCVSVMREQRDMLIADGQDDKYANQMALLALDVQLLKYSIRKARERNSDTVFKDGAEILRLSFEERQKLTTLYSETFDFTEEELGESLRARMDSLTPNSSLPATSRAN